jgi:MEDS: MEthanogen/methylotroph, DcmR Sensory domain
MSNDRSIHLAGSTRKSPLHACAFFASREDEYRVLLPFMKEGIEAGDKCVNILDKAHRAERLERLAAAGIDVAAASWSCAPGSWRMSTAGTSISTRCSRASMRRLRAISTSTA